MQSSSVFSLNCAFVGNDGAPLFQEEDVEKNLDPLKFLPPFTSLPPPPPPPSANGNDTPCSEKNKLTRNEKPKRRFTAYNFFFRHQRKLLLDQLPPATAALSQSENDNTINGSTTNNGRRRRRSRRSHGRIGFAPLARYVSSQWKAASKEHKEIYYEMARKDKIRHDREMAEYVAYQEQEEARYATQQLDRTTPPKSCMYLPAQGVVCSLPGLPPRDNNKASNNANHRVTNPTPIGASAKDAHTTTVTAAAAQRMKRLAAELGDDGIDLVVRTFLPTYE